MIKSFILFMTPAFSLDVPDKVSIDGHRLVVFGQHFSDVGQVVLGPLRQRVNAALEIVGLGRDLVEEVADDQSDLSLGREQREISHGLLRRPDTPRLLRQQVIADFLQTIVRNGSRLEFRFCSSTTL